MFLITSVKSLASNKQKPFLQNENRTSTNRKSYEYFEIWKTGWFGRKMAMGILH